VREQLSRPDSAVDRRTDRLFVAGSVLVGVGFVATFVTLAPLVTGGERLPVIFYLTSLLAPLGLGVILVALWRRARQRRRRLRQSGG
jgi:membrane protein implicated in regulation of membrane protease activity